MNKEYNPETPDPMAVMRISSSYWHSSVLHTAASLDIFTKLANSSATTEEMANMCHADKRGIELILIACVGLGLLNKEGDKFSNTSLAKTFLVEGGPRYQGGIVTMFEEWVSAWQKLKESVTSGKPAVKKPHDQGEEITRKYIMGMYYRGIPQAELLADEVPLTGKKKLLDVGGGPGIFSIIMCQKNQGLKADVLDLPQTLKITKEIIEKHKMLNAVSTREGSYLEDDFGEGYDAVLLSSMINQESPEVIKGILKKSFNSMASGGLLMVQEQFLNTEKTGPLLATLIGINQLLHTPGGSAYSAKEVTDWAEEIGFNNLNFRPLPEPSPFTLITGEMP